jgi:CO dehydrogenase maturation factor
MEPVMKLAVTGKGGVGKTTVASALCRCLRDRGQRVVAVDADPDANLAGTLGHRGAELTPLVKLKAVIEERVGGGEGFGGFLRMNPRVDDIPEQFGVELDGIRLLVMGSIDRGRRGCACPENVLLREVLSHLVLRAGEHVVVDMEAGIEHLGRGTAEGVDHMLVVVEPGWASLQTASRIHKLARDLGLRRVSAVANKVRGAEDQRFIEEGLGELPLLAVLPFDDGLEADARRASPPTRRPFHQELLRVAAALEGGAAPSGVGLPDVLPRPRKDPEA